MIPRYAPQRPLPPYSYVPGMHAHPISHPAGHSYQIPPPPSAAVADLRACETFSYAIDLFNRGFYWEAHEAWETVWNELGRTGETADAIKGLIKLAAAGVKAREATPLGVARHAARALELLSIDSAADLPINLDEVRQLAGEIAARPTDFLNPAQAPCVRIFAVPVQIVERRKS